MTTTDSPIIGIDLGTTNSVVAALMDGRVQVLEDDFGPILPSVVGLSVDGKFIVGQSARNQLAAFPERTIASIKRKMGQAIQVRLGDLEFTPQEISAVILRSLKDRAEKVLGVPVSRAVITVPAFFDENQRQATRDAGQIAGLTVERIINEPTAASLVYHAGTHERKHLIVYDLGGGTFDVSIVRVESGVLEVLTSKGDTQLGGDDFDLLLAKHVAGIFVNQHGFDLMEHPNTRWRLMQACEHAKCELSFSTSVRITEEFIATVNDKPVNLDIEVNREEYESLISPLIERTIECVDAAIRDSSLSLAQLDELILVGGSTRTPLVQRRLREEFKVDPKWAVNPDLAVALGAGTQAAMQEGQQIGPVLIDVATHTLGIEALGDSSDFGHLTYSPILRRNSPLPARYEERFFTTMPGQKMAMIHVYQGESSQLSRNRSLGKFLLEGLSDAPSSDGLILVRFELTLDGTLDVTAIERQTGNSKSLRISNALSEMAGVTVSDSANRLESLFDSAALDGDEGFGEGDESADSEKRITIGRSSSDNSIAVVDETSSDTKLSQLVAKARSMRSKFADADVADIDCVLASIEEAQKTGDVAVLGELEAELDDLLFYLCG